MYFHVEKITPVDNENGYGTAAIVVIAQEGGAMQEVVVNVRMELNWDSTLAETKLAAIDEAKKILTEMVSSF